MTDERVDQTSEVAADLDEAIDPAQLQYLQQQLGADENLMLGVLGGLAAALAGAALWAVITVTTGYQIGFMAIGVGIMVALAVRFLGKGTRVVFGLVGAVLALLGCALGNLLAVTAIVAARDSVPFFSALTQLNPGLAKDLMVAYFQPTDVLFYGLATYEGYKLSFRKLSEEEVQTMLSGTPGPPA